MVAWVMRRVVVADLHLGQRFGDEERFAQLLWEIQERQVGEVIFAGDVFRTLVGFPRFWNGVIRKNLELIAELRRRHVRVIWVEGNRDFFLEDPAMDPFRDRWVQAYGFSSGWRRFLVEHGDLVSRGDYRYRFWRRLSKGKLASVFARILPRSLAQRIVSSTEKALSRTNLAKKRMLPVAELTDAARKHFASGVDVVFWGHFHKPWKLEEGEKQAHVLPAWLETSVVVYIEADGSFSFRNQRGDFVDSGTRICYQEAKPGR